ncbi:MAG: molybdopterin-dependent oxidoreductase, partial [Eggerthellaceae bacterium]|nr:molybdopterin-dependent oxidoreductase [Eggerthellaceae bacterium]
MSEHKHVQLSRRGFLATSAALAGAAALGGSTLTALGAFNDDNVGEAGEQIFSCMCRSNCMGSCRWLVHVADNKIVKLEPGDYPTDGYRGGCLKGYSYIERIYSPTRVKQPLKRKTWAPGNPNVAERGKDEWEAISWDEAIKYVADEFARCRDTYGPKSIMFDSASGQYGYHNGI